jgi:type II restriction enzyme
MKEEVYRAVLKTDDLEAVLEHFLRTLLSTNRTHRFLVDWDKIKAQVESYRLELHLLNALIGSTHFEEDLRTIIASYPQVLPVFPLLLALRDREFRLIDESSVEDLREITYNFTPRTLSPEEVEDLVQFFSRTGLQEFFESRLHQSLQDYLLGVEVGLDTHARKNRSGAFMEHILRPVIEEANRQLLRPFTILAQRPFAALHEYRFPVPAPLEHRRADWILFREADQKLVNIETNFYTETGSKPQEIVDAYIDRSRNLKSYGFTFIWITDGEGWKGQYHQIHKGFRELDFLLNLSMARRGFLQEILCRI